MTVETDRRIFASILRPMRLLFQQGLKHSNSLLNSIFLHRLPSHPYYQAASVLQKYCVPWLTAYVLTIILWGTEAVGNEHIGWVYKPYIAISKWKIGTIRPSIKWFINECGNIFRKTNFSLARRVSNPSVIALIRRRHHSTEWQPSIFNLKTTIILNFIFI